MDRQDNDDLYRALLSCVAELERFVDFEESRESARPIMNSTRALVRLLEGWCVDHAVRFEADAISGFDEDEKNDAAILTALRAKFRDLG